MKKLSDSTINILMIVGAILFVIGFYTLIGLKRSEKCEYKLTYQIYHPNNTITKTATFKGGNNMYYILTSTRGTNYIKVGEGNGWFLQGNSKRIITTSAPIEIVSFNKRPINYYNEK